MHKHKSLTKLALLLTFVGSLNWGLVGLFNFDLVAALFGRRSPVARIVYITVFLAHVFMLILIKKKKMKHEKKKWMPWGS